MIILGLVLLPILWKLKPDFQILKNEDDILVHFSWLFFTIEIHFFDVENIEKNIESIKKKSRGGKPVPKFDFSLTGENFVFGILIILFWWWVILKWKGIS